MSIKAPGASYLFVWPLLFAAAAALASRWVRGAEWIAARDDAHPLVGFAYGVSVVMLGVAGAGAIALGVLTSLVALLLAPHVDRLAARREVGRRRHGLPARPWRWS